MFSVRERPPGNNWRARNTQLSLQTQRTASLFIGNLCAGLCSKAMFPKTGGIFSYLFITQCSLFGNGLLGMTREREKLSSLYKYRERRPFLLEIFVLTSAVQQCFLKPVGFFFLQCSLFRNGCLGMTGERETLSALFRHREQRSFSLEISC